MSERVRLSVLTNEAGETVGTALQHPIEPLLTEAERQQILAMTLQAKLEDALRDWAKMANGHPLPKGNVPGIAVSMLEFVTQKVRDGKLPLEKRAGPRENL